MHYYRLEGRKGWEGRRDFINVWSDTELAVYTTSHKIRQTLLDLSWATLRGNGDKEWRFIFPPEHLDEVARMIRCNKKRKLSEAHRERLLAAGTASRFPARATDVENGSRTRSRGSGR